MKPAWIGIGGALLLSVLGGGAAECATPSKGRSIFTNICARCHGIDGTGDGAMKWTPPVPDLTAPEVQRKLDATLFHRIHEGKPGSAMGAWKATLSEQDVGDVLAYVRTLSR